MVPLTSQRSGVPERRRALHHRPTAEDRDARASLDSHPSAGYGGIEFVVALLCDALVESGHAVELFCAPGSSSKASVHPVLEAVHPEHIERALVEAGGLLTAEKEKKRARSKEVSPIWPAWGDERQGRGDIGIRGHRHPAS